MPKTVIITGSFDDLRSRHVRLLQEASRLGRVHVLLWTDAMVEAVGSARPKFPQDERRYLLEAIRYVDRVSLCNGPADSVALPEHEIRAPAEWVVDSSADTPAKRAFCQRHALAYRVLGPEDLQGFPEEPSSVVEPAPGRKKVIVTGCYDWFHSGHVRFFEEVSALGDLYVGLGHDANLRLLKGEGHPLFPANERRYLVQAVRFVKQAFVSSGNGWLDAEPEIQRLRPDIYAVNEDGDRPEKREYCRSQGIEYRVLKRVPKQGLPRRQSTELRGF